MSKPRHRGFFLTKLTKYAASARSHFAARGLGARFEDPAIESAFLDDFRRTGAQFAKFASVAGAVMALAFAILASLEPERDANHEIRQVIRLVLAGLLVSAAVYIALQPKAVVKNYLMAVGLPSVIGCVTVAALGFLPTDMEWPRSGRLTAAMCVTCYLVYGFTRLPATILLLICGGASALAVLGAMKNGDDYPQAIVIYLTVANLSGWLLAIQIEKREREIFSKSTDLTKAARDLEVSARASEDASAAKTHVLAAVSHDLRQPLASMSLYLSVLRSSVAVQNPGVSKTLAGLAECIAAMSDNLSRLSNIAELQDRNRLLPIETVDARVLMRRLRSVYAGQAHKSGIRLVVRVPKTGALLAASNNARLWEVLANLVSNAVKFGRKGGRGWVLVRITEFVGTLRLTVRDNGVGIDPAFHRRVFDEYFQVGNPQRDREKGYGLGLSIVRETVSRLVGHELKMTSKLGFGTRFDLTLPKTALGPSELPKVGCELVTPERCAELSVDDVVPSDPLCGCYALLVEDDPLIRRALTAVMERWGMLIEVAGSHEEALTIVRRVERAFDVVVSDFKLAGCSDGLSVIGAVRSAQGSRTPAILLSGAHSSIDPERLTQAGARALSKPLDVVHLRAELEACVAT